MFAFGKKGELKKAIENSKQRLQTIASEKESIINAYQERITAVNKQADADSKNAELEIEKNYPIPESPKEKEQKRKEAEKAEKKRKELEKAQNELLNNLNTTERELYYVLDGCREEG